MNIQEDTGAITLGDGAGCIGNTITGNIQVTDNTGNISLYGNLGGHDRMINGNTGTVKVFSNAVQHFLSCDKNKTITGANDSAVQRQKQCSAF